MPRLPRLSSLVLPSLCLAAACVATWPLPWRFATTLPLGTEHEATVPLFNLWSLWWVSDRLAAGFSGLWTAPIFHPLAGTFTFSEPLLLQGSALAPLWWLGVPPAAIYNLALLLTLAANGLATATLVRVLGVERRLQLVAALGGVLLPYAAKVLGVLPVLPLFGALWALAATVRFGEKGGFKAAFAIAAGCVTQFLAGQQMALLTLPLVAAAGLFAWSERRYRGRALVELLAAAALVAVVVTPLAATSRDYHQRYGFSRSDEVVEALSARPADFATRPGTARLPVPPVEDTYHGDTGGLFPGLLLALLAAVGWIWEWRAGARRRWLLFLGSAVAFSLLLSLGLHLSVGGWRPFATLRELVPGFDALRSPFRAAALAQVLLVALATLALARLSKWKGSRGPLLAVTLGILAVAENLAGPGRLVQVPRTPETTWARWLRDQPGKVVVAHLPLPTGLHVSDYERDTWRMFAQTAHGKTLLNGYSGYFPSGYGLFQRDVDESFPAVRLLCMMKVNFGVSVLAVDEDWYNSRRDGFTREDVSPFLRQAFVGDGVMLFRLREPPGACRP